MFRTTLLTGALAALLSAASASAQTITVTIGDDIVDVDWQTATVADLPGPDGEVSFSEAMIASNHTAGVQTIAFNIPQSKWLMQWLFPGRAVLKTTAGVFWIASAPVIIDGRTQTAFTGDTYADGNEVTVYGGDFVLNANNCELYGFDTVPVTLGGQGGRIEGNTGQMAITLFDATGALIKDNEASTIKIDRSNNNVLVGNTMQRVRIWGFDSSYLAVGNRVGGPNLADRNFITGYGTHSSEGFPSGSAIELFNTSGTVIENNYIGTTPDGMAIGNIACSVGVQFMAQNDGTILRQNLIGILGHGTGPHYAGTLWGWALRFEGTGDGIVVQGNTIGLDATGAATLGSVWGIDAGDGYLAASYTNLTLGGSLPGEGNEIAGHYLNGITVGKSVDGVRISGNSIHDNGWLGIDLVPSGFGYGVDANDPGDLDDGGNGLQNFPVLNQALDLGGSTWVSGSLSSTAGDDFTVELFASPTADDSGFGEGELFLGSLSVTTDGSGNADFGTLLSQPVPAGWVISATATLEPIGSTSEFSQAITIQPGNGDLGTRYCSPAVTNSTGLPGTLRAMGSDVVADQLFILRAEDLPANEFGLFLVSATQAFIQNPGGSQGNLCLGGTIARFSHDVKNSGPTGTFSLAVDLTQLPGPLNVPVMPGDTWNFQAWHRDKNPMPTSNFTDAVSVTFQ